jgi:ATP-dependent Lon protease
MAELGIPLPKEIPVMTLPGSVLFPQAVMPLYIFEPRYRQMLNDVLINNRLFAVVGLDISQSTKSDQFEPPHDTGTVGIIRVCHKNQDGTSNLVLQGLIRIQVNRIVQENPYRIIDISPLESSHGVEEEELDRKMKKLSKLLLDKQEMGGKVAKKIMQQLLKVKEPEAFVDLAAYAFCSNPLIKQKILSTLSVTDRFEIYFEELETELKKLKLSKRYSLLDEEDISFN